MLHGSKSFSGKVWNTRPFPTAPPPLPQVKMHRSAQLSKNHIRNAVRDLLNEPEFLKELFSNSEFIEKLEWHLTLGSSPNDEKNK